MESFFSSPRSCFESPVYLEEVADVLCILQAGQWCNIFDVKSVKTLLDKLVKKTPLNYSDTILNQSVKHFIQHVRNETLAKIILHLCVLLVYI